MWARSKLFSEPLLVKMLLVSRCFLFVADSSEKETKIDESKLNESFIVPRIFCGNRSSHDKDSLVWQETCGKGAGYMMARGATNIMGVGWWYIRIRKGSGYRTHSGSRGRIRPGRGQDTCQQGTEHMLAEGRTHAGRRQDTCWQGAEHMLSGGRTHAGRG